MLITIKYFGQIAEVTQKEKEQLNVSARIVSELLSFLNIKYPALKNKNFQVAQNQELVALDTKIIDKTEIALLPPFAGG